MNTASAPLHSARAVLRDKAYEAFKAKSQYYAGRRFDSHTAGACRKRGPFFFAIHQPDSQGFFEEARREHPAKAIIPTIAGDL